MSRSTPSSSSGRSGDDATSAGWTLTGRRLANSPSPPRSAKSACSGRTGADGSDHFGPPTAPSRIASAARQASTSSGADRDAVRVDRDAAGERPRSSRPRTRTVGRPRRRRAGRPRRPPARPRRPGSWRCGSAAVRPPSRQALLGPLVRERDGDAVDLGAVELVGRHEVRVERRLDDVRAITRGPRPRARPDPRPTSGGSGPAPGPGRPRRPRRP